MGVDVETQVHTDRTPWVETPIELSGDVSDAGTMTWCNPTVTETPFVVDSVDTTPIVIVGTATDAEPITTTPVVEFSKTTTTIEALDKLLSESEDGELASLVEKGELQVEELFRYSPGSIGSKRRFIETVKLIEEHCSQFASQVRVAKAGLEMYSDETPLAIEIFWQQIIGQVLKVSPYSLTPTRFRFLKVTDSSLAEASQMKNADQRSGSAYILVADYDVIKFDPSVMIYMFGDRTSRIDAILEVGERLAKNITDLLIASLRSYGKPSAEEAFNLKEKILKELGNNAKSSVMRFIAKYILSGRTTKSFLPQLSKIASTNP